jgi:hypothetical protein
MIRHACGITLAVVCLLTASRAAAQPGVEVKVDEQAGGGVHVIVTQDAPSSASQDRRAAPALDRTQAPASRQVTLVYALPFDQLRAQIEQRLGGKGQANTGRPTDFPTVAEPAGKAERVARGSELDSIYLRVTRPAAEKPDARYALAAASAPGYLRLSAGRRKGQAELSFLHLAWSGPGQGSAAGEDQLTAKDLEWLRGLLAQRPIAEFPGQPPLANEPWGRLAARDPFAATPTAELSEADKIELLIAAVEKSGMTFVRNGKEYPSREAADHLRLKVSRAGKRVKTAQQFIEHLASKSSMSGKDYLLKQPDGSTIASRDWMRAELAAIESRGLKSPAAQPANKPMNAGE